MAQRPPIKFSLGGAASSKNSGGHVSASPAARSASPRSPSPRAVLAPRSEPAIVEVLRWELAVASLEGEAALASLTEAGKQGGLFACLRREASKGAGSAWSAVFDLAKYSPPENGSEPRRMTALCVKSSSRAEPPEALAALRQLLADAGLKPWPLVAGEEELILVDHARARAAAHTLIAAGHAVGPPALISPPPASKGGLKADLVAKFCGVWRLTRRERPPSSVVEKFGRGDGALRIVAPSGVYVEVSILSPGEVVGQASSCGVLSIEDVDGQLILERHATLSFEPPIGGARSSRVTLDAGAGDDGEDVAVESLIDDSKGSEVDHWERVGSGEVTVLELAGVEPSPSGGHTHSGYWLFCGGYWARITGLSHGTGLTAGRCCRSLEQAQEVYGEEEVAAEMRSHYRASCGEIDRPGVLSTLREAWAGVSKDGILYDANKNRDEVRKDGDNIVHSPGDGPSTTWDIRAFGLDPFTPVPKRSSKPETPKGLRKSGGSSDSDEDSDKPKKSDSSSDSDKEEKKKAASDSDSDSSSAKKKESKEKEKEKEKEKKSRSSSSGSSKAKKKEDRSRSRDKKKSRDRSKDKKKDRSRDRRDRSRKDARDRDRKDRSKSRSKKDRRSRSRRDKDRDRDRDRKDRSRDRDRDRRDKSRDKKDRDRSRDRRDRSRDRDKKKRSRSRDRKKDRSRSRDKDKKDKDRSRSRGKDKEKEKEKEKKSDKKDKKAKDSSDSDSDDKKKSKKKKKKGSSSSSSDADAKKAAEKKEEKKEKAGSDSSSDSDAEKKKKKDAAKKSDSSDSDDNKDKKDAKKEADKKSDSSDSDDDKKAKKKKEGSDSDKEAKKNGDTPAKKSEAAKDSDSDSS